MKFRTISRIVYLKKARHRRGHGIHSPFLFHLITTVLEDKKRLPEYRILKELKGKVLNSLSQYSEQSLGTLYRLFNLPPSNPRKLYRKVELPLQYGKVVFRLIREFKPSSVINYGPTLGVNLALMAMANDNIFVSQLINDSFCELISSELLKGSAITNVSYFRDNSVLLVNPAFVMINYAHNPELSRSLVEKKLEIHGDDDVLIIRGIHESKEMEAIWGEIVASESARVSLDLFEIGIVLFRKGLQKEKFVLKY